MVQGRGTVTLCFNRNASSLAISQMASIIHQVSLAHYASLVCPNNNSSWMLVSLLNNSKE